MDMRVNPESADLQGRCFLLTGGSGFLGRRLLSRLLHAGADVLLLLRDKSSRGVNGPAMTAAERAASLLENLDLVDHASRLHVIRGDLSDLDSSDVGAQVLRVLRELGSTGLVLVNVAASLRMDHTGQPEAVRQRIADLNRRTNVDGLRGLLEVLDGLARQRVVINGRRVRIALEHVLHFGTAYAHGSRHGKLPELPFGDDPTNNSYEQTKREGERVLQRWMARGMRCSITVLRPAIVTGPDTRDGFAAFVDTLAEPVNLAGLHPLLRRVVGLRGKTFRRGDLLLHAVARLRLPVLPMLGNPDAVIDLIDVADVDRFAWAALTRECLRHDTGSAPAIRYLQLANPRASTLRDLTRDLLQAFDPAPGVGGRAQFIGDIARFGLALDVLGRVPMLGPALRAFYQRTTMLQPYLLRASRTRFDTTQTAAYFADMGIDYRPRRIDEDYVRGLLRGKSDAAVAMSSAACGIAA